MPRQHSGRWRVSVLDHLIEVSLEQPQSGAQPSHKDQIFFWNPLQGTTTYRGNNMTLDAVATNLLPMHRRNQTRTSLVVNHTPSWWEPEPRRLYNKVDICSLLPPSDEASFHDNAAGCWSWGWRSPINWDAALASALSWGTGKWERNARQCHVFVHVLVLWDEIKNEFHLTTCRFLWGRLSHGQWSRNLTYYWKIKSFLFEIVKNINICYIYLK